MEVSTWENCYNDQWRGTISDESHAHPAKMSKGLLIRILDYVQTQGYAKKNDLIVDCFGGVGTTGIMGAYKGFRVICVELESRFCTLANQNFDLHRRAWETMGYPMPIIIQGDSRFLCEIIEKADCCVTSPPFADCEPTQDDNFRYKGKPLGSTGDHYGHTSGQIGNMKLGDVSAVITSPSYAETIQSGLPGIDWDKAGRPDRTKPSKNRHHPMSTDEYSYSHDPSNIGNMKAGDIVAVITSPPWAEIVQHDGGPAHQEGGELHSDYGTTEGQIGKMRGGDIAAIVTSPPFEKQVSGGGIAKSIDGKSDYPVFGGLARGKKAARASHGLGYQNQGDSFGQIASETGENYWTACKAVYASCYQVLKPGGVIICVVKSFIKKGRRVPLPMQTLKLLIHLGFEPLERIKAMLVEETVTPGLFGEMKKIRSRKSFFRRLCEKKGSPEINFEEVLICRK